MFVEYSKNFKGKNWGNGDPKLSLERQNGMDFYFSEGSYSETVNLGDVYEDEIFDYCNYFLQKFGHFVEDKDSTHIVNLILRGCDP